MITVHQVTRIEVAGIQYFNSLEKATYNAKGACPIRPVERIMCHAR